MTRPLRIEHAGAHYHGTSQENERKAIFRDDTDREKFLLTKQLTVPTLRYGPKGPTQDRRTFTCAPFKP